MRGIGGRGRRRWSVFGALLLAPLTQTIAVADTPTPTPTPTTAPTLTQTATRTATRTPTILPLPMITAPGVGQVISVSGVNFAWTTVAGATGYDLRVINVSTSAVVFSGSVVGNGTTTTLVSLPANGSYQFRVRACESGMFSDATCGGFATRNFSVSLTAPAAAPTVTQPAANAMLTSSVQTLAWTTVSGTGSLPVSYELQLTNQSTGHVELHITVPDPTNMTVAQLRSALYQLQVRACQAGCGPWSTPVSFMATIGAAPSATPTITSATVSGGNAANIAWTSVAGAEWYQLYVIQPPPAGPGNSALTVAARQVVGTSVSGLPVPAGAANAIVAACTGNGCGPFSASMGLSPAGPNPNAPQLATPLSGSVVAGPGVQFSWSRVPGDTGSNTIYRLYVQDQSRQTAALDVLTTQNLYAAYLPAEGAQYAALVVAKPWQAGAVTGPSIVFNVQGSSFTAPTLTAPTNGSQLPPGNVLIGWSPVPGATLYEYFVAVTGQSAASARGVTPGLFVQVPLGAVNGQPTSYTAIARACPAAQTCASGSDAGWGPWSNVAGSGGTTFTIAPPPAPVGGSSLHFRGNGSGDIDRVKIALDDAPNRPVDVGGDFTVEFWMKTASGNGSGSCSGGGEDWTNGNVIIDRDVFGGGDLGAYGLSLFGSAGHLAFGVTQGMTGNTICGMHAVADGAWHHVAATRRESDGALSLYVDGQLDASGGGPTGDVSYHNGRASSHPTTDPYLVVGAEKFDTGQAFHGWLDELRISSALRYTMPFTAPTAPFAADNATAALYHFDEDNGNTVFDSSITPGGPSNGVRSVGGSPTGPLWSADTPFTSTAPVIAFDTLTTALNGPTSITNAGDQRVFITEQGGAIRIWDGAQLRATPFLTVAPITSGGERGLLGLAFHPNYAQNGFFFVYYTDPSGNPTIARYHVSADPDVADASSGVVLLSVNHPGQSNHNGGQLQFGPDGYLYAGFGDGGGGCDDSGPGCNAQRDNELLGKLIRIDVNQNVNAPPFYGIPPDNPFAGPGDPLNEIWAKGLRNPWRFSFDRLTQSLFIADVGQDTREEIDLQVDGVPGGRNYGWKVMEGFLCNTCALSDCPTMPAPPPCNDPSLTLPILDYGHNPECAVVGGYVYRGTQVPFLSGKYVFGDLCSGKLWWTRDNEGTWSKTAFAPTEPQLWTWGQDSAGELYVGLGTGSLLRLRAGP